MNLKPYIPSPAAISRETLTVLAGLLLAATVLHLFPKVKAFVRDASISQDSNT